MSSETPEINNNAHGGGDAPVAAKKNIGQSATPLFSDLRGDAFINGDLDVTEIESVCMRCFEQGITRMMLTKIPFFKEVVISSFQCNSCGYKDSQIMDASEIQPNGVKYTFTVKQKNDLQRNLVKGTHCTVKIEELGFEIPACRGNKSLFTTLEGLLSRALEDLEMDQGQRAIECPEIYAQIRDFLEKARQVTGLDEDFTPNCTITFYDPSGNSFVENPHAPYPDPRLRIDHIARSKDELAAMGYQPDHDEDEEDDGVELPEAHGGLDLQNEVLSIPSTCPNCKKPCSANFKQVMIPFFKEVIIMATVCDHCGQRSNEVKAAQGFEDFGLRISLAIRGGDDRSKDHEFDMARDILKSDTCDIEIPELDFKFGAGAIPSKFTTVEGLLQDIHKTVTENPFTAGDSAMAKTKANVVAFGDKINNILAGKMAITLILDDAAGNSYIQNLNAPDVDPDLKEDKYTRTEEQNDELGISGMCTEGYEDPHALAEKLEDVKLDAITEE